MTTILTLSHKISIKLPDPIALVLFDVVFWWSRQNSLKIGIPELIDACGSPALSQGWKSIINIFGAHRQRLYSSNRRIILFHVPERQRHIQCTHDYPNVLIHTTWQALFQSKAIQYKMDVPFLYLPYPGFKPGTLCSHCPQRSSRLQRPQIISLQSL